MAETRYITAERLREILHYDPETGVWTWTYARPKNNRSGRVAGCKNEDGYLQIKVDFKTYSAHDLAFLYMNGEWSRNQIDHRDLDKMNCKWNNLREATASQNAANRRAFNKGKKGTSFDSKRGLWSAMITKNGKSIYLGRFQTEEMAHDAYCKAAVELHGEFARFA